MSPRLQDELDSALATVLVDMQQAVAELTQALEAECAALVARNSDALDHAGAHKQAIMLQLEQLDAERQQLGRELPAAATALEPIWAKVVQSLRRLGQFDAYFLIIFFYLEVFLCFFCLALQTLQLVIYFKQKILDACEVLLSSIQF